MTSEPSVKTGLRGPQGNRERGEVGPREHPSGPGRSLPQCSPVSSLTRPQGGSASSHRQALDSGAELIPTEGRCHPVTHLLGKFWIIWKVSQKTWCPFQTRFSTRRRKIMGCCCCFDFCFLGEELSKSYPPFMTPYHHHSLQDIFLVSLSFISSNLCPLPLPPHR